MLFFVAMEQSKGVRAEVSVEKKVWRGVIKEVNNHSITIHVENLHFMDRGGTFVNEDNGIVIGYITMSNLQTDVYVFYTSNAEEAGKLVSLIGKPIYLAKKSDNKIRWNQHLGKPPKMDDETVKSRICLFTNAEWDLFVPLYEVYNGIRIGHPIKKIPEGYLMGGLHRVEESRIISELFYKDIRVDPLNRSLEEVELRRIDFFKNYQGLRLKLCNHTSNSKAWQFLVEDRFVVDVKLIGNDFFKTTAPEPSLLRRVNQKLHEIEMQNIHNESWIKALSGFSKEIDPRELDEYVTKNVESKRKELDEAYETLELKLSQLSVNTESK